MKKANDDYVTYASIVRRECERFRLNELTADHLKCLIDIQGLMTKRDSEIRSRILSKLEEDSKQTLLAVAEEREKIMYLKHDTAKIQDRNVFHVQGVCQKLNEKREKVISMVLLWRFESKDLLSRQWEKVFQV